MVSKWLPLPRTRVNKVHHRDNNRVNNKRRMVPAPALAQVKDHPQLNKPKPKMPTSSKCSSSRFYSKPRLLLRVMLLRLLSRHNRLRRNIMLLRRICKTHVPSARVKRGQFAVLQGGYELTGRPNGNGPDQEQVQNQNQTQPNSAGVSCFCA
jgi:hypothetical protein